MKKPLSIIVLLLIASTANAADNSEKRRAEINELYVKCSFHKLYGNTNLKNIPGQSQKYEPEWQDTCNAVEKLKDESDLENTKIRLEKLK